MAEIVAVGTDIEEINLAVEQANPDDRPDARLKLRLLICQIQALMARGEQVE